MSKVPERLSWLVTVRPWITIIVLLIVTVVLAAGGMLRAPPTEGASVAFLPPGNAIADATREIDEFFGGSGKVSVVTLIFRGDALTPEGLAQMDALIGQIVSDQCVGELLVPTDPVFAPSILINSVAQMSGAESVNQAVIDTARGIPEITGALAAMTGTDTDGTPVRTGRRSRSPTSG